MKEILRGIRVSNDVVTFYTTADGTKQRRTLPADFIFASNSMYQREAETLSAEIFNTLGLKGQIVDSGYLKTLHLRGDSAVRKQLEIHWRKLFKHSLHTSGPEKYHMRYPLYTLLEFNGNERPEIVGICDAKDVPGRECAIDIEKKAIGNDRFGLTAMNVLVSDTEKALFVLEENAPDSLEGFSIVIEPDEKSIALDTSKALQNYDTVYIHNAPFDITELRNTKTKKTEKVLAGEDGYEPQVRGRNFVRRVWHPGLDFVDTCKFSQDITPNISDKLNDFCAYWGKGQKTLTHEDLELIINNPNPGNNKTVAKYAATDGWLELEVGKEVGRTLAPAALLLGRTPGHISAVSKYTLGRQHRDMECWRRFNAYREAPNLRYSIQVKRHIDQRVFDIWKNFDYEDEKTKILKKDLELKVKRGLIRNVEVLFPILFRPTLITNIETLENSLWDEDYRVRQARAELYDALCEEQLFDMKQCGEGKWSEDDFKLTYGMKPQDLKNQMKERIGKILAYCKENRCAPINIGTRFLYLEKEPVRSLFSFADESKVHEFGVVFGTADSVLSMGTGNIIYRVKGKLFSEGSDVLGRHGLRNDFERNAIKTLVLGAFDNNISKARDNYSDLLRKLQQHNVPDNELAVKIRNTSRYKSIQAQESLRATIIRELGLWEEGDEAIAVYGIDDKWHRLEEGVEPNSQFYLRRAIGRNKSEARTATVARFDYMLKPFDESLYGEFWTA